MRSIATASIILACALIGSCSPKIDDAKTIVKEQLLDGESARFENVVSQKTELVNGAIQPASTSAVCGWVNAKNRMGGYTGAQRFVVKAGTPTFGTAADEEWSEAFIMCVVHSDDKSATDRLSREGDRALDALGEAVNALKNAQD